MNEAQKVQQDTCLYCGLPIYNQRANKFFHNLCRQKYFYWYRLNLDKTDAMTSLIGFLTGKGILENDVGLFIHHLPPGAKQAVIEALGYEWSVDRWVKRVLD